MSSSVLLQTFKREPARRQLVVDFLAAEDIVEIGVVEQLGEGAPVRRVSLRTALSAFSASARPSFGSLPRRP